MKGLWTPPDYEEDARRRKTEREARGGQAVLPITLQILMAAARPAGGGASDSFWMGYGRFSPRFGFEPGWFPE